MSDLEIAGLLMAFAIGLAIAAPLWGYDSRDGVESDQSSRRVAWLHDRPSRQLAGSTRAAKVALAGVLRTVACRLDDEVAVQTRPERLAQAY